VVVTKNNNMMTWDIDDNRIATVDVSAIALGGANIALGVSDVNGTTARHPSLVFTVFDNLKVTDIGAALAGDFNHDGHVDAADLTKWQGDYGGGAGSDANGDGASDGADFLAWQKNVGATSAVASATGVPEPASHVGAMIALLCCSCRRRPAR
jgi:hypothetical protein